MTGRIRSGGKCAARNCRTESTGARFKRSERCVSRSVAAAAARGRSCGVCATAGENEAGDQHHAFSIAAWLSRADRDGSLAAFLKPDLTPPERAVAQAEGWMLGVPGLIRAGGERNNPAPTACNSIMSSLN